MICGPWTFTAAPRKKGNAYDWQEPRTFLGQSRGRRRVPGGHVPGAPDAWSAPTTRPPSPPCRPRGPGPRMQMTLASEKQAALVHWWTTFQDPMLTTLVERAVQSNLDLQLAASRLRQARALRGVAAADLSPQVTANAGFTRSQGVGHERPDLAEGPQPLPGGPGRLVGTRRLRRHPAKRRGRRRQRRSRRREYTRRPGDSRRRGRPGLHGPSRVPAADRHRPAKPGGPEAQRRPDAAATRRRPRQRPGRGQRRRAGGLDRRHHPPVGEPGPAGHLRPERAAGPAAGGTREGTWPRGRYPARAAGGPDRPARRTAAPPARHPPGRGPDPRQHRPRRRGHGRPLPQVQPYGQRGPSRATRWNRC